MQSVFANAAAVSFGAVPARPEEGVLWHYTTGSTLASIIQQSSIWSTRLDCLNDNSEYKLAFRLLSEIIDLRHSSAAEGNERIFHEYLVRRLNETPRYFEMFFVVCFSVARDDLSQWRAYGGQQGENGYAIAFDADELIGSPRISLQRVEYREQFLRRHLSLVIDGMFKMFLEGVGNRAHEGGVIEAWQDIAYTVFERAAIRTFTAFKDHAFRDEEEWRLVRLTNPQARLSFQFSQTGAMLRQHLPFDGGDIREGKKLLPIREVMVGPSRHALTSKATVANLLNSRGYTKENLGWDVEISVSKTPFQST